MLSRGYGVRRMSSATIRLPGPGLLVKSAARRDGRSGTASAARLVEGTGMSFKKEFQDFALKGRAGFELTVPAP
jgi:hypothetical protein